MMNLLVLEAPLAKYASEGSKNMSIANSDKKFENDLFEGIK